MPHICQLTLYDHVYTSFQLKGVCVEQIRVFTVEIAVHSGHNDNCSYL